ncbi:MAG: peptidase M20, partial [Phycisphaerae bacterium]
YLKAAEKSLRETYNRDVIMSREGGTLPILPMFKRVLGADSIMLGFASPYCNAHGPNEKARIPDLDLGAEVIARLFGHLSK